MPWLKIGYYVLEKTHNLLIPIPKNGQNWETVFLYVLQIGKKSRNLSQCQLLVIAVAVLKWISTAEFSSSSSSASRSTITDRRSVLAWETRDTLLWPLSWQSLALVDCGGVMIVHPWGRKAISIIVNSTSFKSNYAIIKFKSIIEANRFECTTYLKMLSLLVIWLILKNI